MAVVPLNHVKHFKTIKMKQEKDKIKKEKPEIKKDNKHILSHETIFTMDKMDVAGWMGLFGNPCRAQIR